MERTITWLPEAMKAIAEIQHSVSQLDEELRQVTYEVLLGHWLRVGNGGNSRPSIEASAPEVLAESGPQSTRDGSRFTRQFLAPHGLPMYALDEIIDPKTGEILVHDLGRTKAEVQRRLGALLSLAHFVKEGVFIFPQVELVEKCRHYGVYDKDNFATTLKDASFNGGVVFVRDGESWRVTKPGERYVANVVKLCLETVGSRHPPGDSPSSSISPTDPDIRG
jgi:hypothetical protein